MGTGSPIASERGASGSVAPISLRSRAYLILWLLMGLVILVRRVPEVPVTLDRGDQERFSVDLNQDGWERLTLIRGIGESLARRIIDARESRPFGRFESLEEVLRIPGIPDRPLCEASPWLSLDGTACRPSESGSSSRMGE